LLLYFYWFPISLRKNHGVFSCQRQATGAANALLEVILSLSVPLSSWLLSAVAVLPVPRDGVRYGYRLWRQSHFYSM
ncbi:hypothetical protein ACVS9W_000001, partial [Cronobacter dublinensis]